MVPRGSCAGGQSSFWGGRTVSSRWLIKLCPVGTRAFKIDSIPRTRAKMRQRQRPGCSHGGFPALSGPLGESKIAEWLCTSSLCLCTAETLAAHARWCPCSSSVPTRFSSCHGESLNKTLPSIILILRKRPSPQGSPLGPRSASPAPPATSASLRLSVQTWKRRAGLYVPALQSPVIPS